MAQSASHEPSTPSDSERVPDSTVDPAEGPEALAGAPEGLKRAHEPLDQERVELPEEPLDAAGQSKVETELGTAIDDADFSGAASGLDGPRPVPALPVIPGYRVESIIGRGSTGTVYRAWQLAVEREVALKVLHPELSGKPRVIQRLQREARTLARLAHPHIVGAIDMGRANDCWWFAMELVDGPSLEERLRTEGRLTEREALRLLTPVVEALEHLWEHGVVHRDVKPGNILLDSSAGGRGRNARLADLGLAFAENDPNLTAAGGALGTPHYISPEQARDASGVDIRSDLWALGATWFHAVCGRPPFSGRGVAEVLSAVLHARIPDPRELNSELSRGMTLVLRKLLAREASDRYQTPRELLADLELLRERRAPRVRAAELDPLESERPFWRSPWVAAALFGAVGALGGWTWANRPWANQPIQELDAEVAVEVFGPLEQLRRRALDDPSRLGAALVDLDGMRSEIPDGASSRFWSVRDDLLDALDSHLTDLLADAGEQLSELLKRRELAAARVLLEESLPESISARVGLMPGALPTRAAEAYELWLGPSRRRVESEIEQAREALRSSAMAWFDAELAPRVASQRGTGYYAQALLDLDRGPEELLGELPGGSGPALPPDERERIVDELRLRLGSLRDQVQADWSRRVVELGQWLSDEFADRRLRIRAGELEGLEPELAVSLQAHIEGPLGLERAALPEAGLVEIEARAAARQAELRELAADVVDTRLARSFEIRRDWITPLLLGQRAYERAEEVLRGFERELGRAPQELRRRERHRRREEELGRLHLAAERLTGVLAAATESLRSQRDSVARFEVTENLVVSGRLSVGKDPLLDGFRLTEERGTQHLLTLEALDRRDLERLAFWPDQLESRGTLAELSPEARLDLALLRYAEGDAIGTRAALEGGPLPRREDLQRLALELQSNLSSIAGLSAATPENEVDAMLAELDSDWVEHDPLGGAVLIEAMLLALGEHPSIGLRHQDLRNQASELEATVGLDRLQPR